MGELKETLHIIVFVPKIFEKVVGHMEKGPKIILSKFLPDEIAFPANFVGHLALLHCKIDPKHLVLD